MRRAVRRPERLSELGAVLAVLLVVVVSVLAAPSELRLTLVGVALMIMGTGWLWTMRRERRVREEAAAKVARMEVEVAEAERVLQASLSSQAGKSIDADVGGSLRSLVRTLRAEAAICYTVDRERGLLTPMPGAVGMGPGSLHDYKLGSSRNTMVEEVMSSRRPYLRRDESGGAVPRLLPKGYTDGSVLIAPMIVDNEVVGVLAIAGEEPGLFSSKDIELAMATGTSCGIQLTNQQLLAQSRMQLRHSMVVKEVALAVNSTLDLDHVLQLFLGKAQGLVEYDRAAVALFDNGNYRVAMMVDGDGNTLHHTARAMRGSIAGSVFEQVERGSLVVREHLSHDDQFATTPPDDISLGTFYSEALVPVRARGKVAGCVAFRAAGVAAFPAAAQPVLYELANLGGMAISNSLTLRDSESQTRQLDLLLDALEDVSQTLTATTQGPAALERQVAETVATIFDSPLTALTRVSTGSHDIVATFPPETIEAIDTRVVSGAGLLGAVALRHGTSHLSGVDQGELLPPLQWPGPALTSGLATPMFLDGEFRGSLAVFRGRPYGETEAGVLATVANQVGVALRNAELFHQSQRALWELSNLHDALKAITSSLELPEVLESILSRAAAVSGAQIGAIMLVDDGDLRLQATYGTDASTADGLGLGVGYGVAEQVVRTGDAVLVNDVSRDPRLASHRDTAILPKALLCVPMSIGKEVIGVMTLSNYLDDAFFQDDAVQVVKSLATQTSIAVENARVYQRLRTERDRLISLEEVLRQDLARDLHDGPVQRLAGMAMNIEVIKTLLKRDPKRALGELDELDKLVGTTIREARTMLFELRPLVLETQGLNAALSSYAEQFEANTNIKVDLDLDDSLGRLPPAVEQTLFSIAQEALGNVRKHARATTVRVELRPRGSEVTLQVVDDGRGFDVDATQAGYAKRESQSLGLVNMIERAERVGGRLRLESKLRQGTTVVVTIPSRYLEVRASTA
jgi:signal transduction histidine kinase